MIKIISADIRMAWRKALIQLARSIEWAGVAKGGLLKRVHSYRFRSCGARVSFCATDSFTYENTTVGSDVLIGRGAILWATDAHLTIGSKVIIGPGLVVMTGNHNIGEIGQFMCDVHAKRGKDDEDVTIADDVWIGARVTILKGVTVGRGSVVGAGSVVTKSIAPYMIVAGNPARNLRARWPLEVILQHETILYDERKRLSEVELRLAGHR